MNTSYLETLLPLLAILLLVALVALKSIHSIGATEVGLVKKRIGKKLPGDNPIAFKGEAGYQAGLLMPGLRFRLWPIFSVEKFPWVQIPAGHIGVVLAQIGDPIPVGYRSAVYKKEFGMFTNLAGFVDKGGQKGVQRPVLPPGTLLPLHPVAFLVLTTRQVYGIPVDPDIKRRTGGRDDGMDYKAFGLEEESQLKVTVIAPEKIQDGDGEKGLVDQVGIVNTLEGPPLPPGDIACRLGGFKDVGEMEKEDRNTDPNIIEVLLGSQNTKHNSYQDYQAFLDADGRIGLQHDPLLYGAYNLNPFLVKVTKAPMLVVKQGEVAVVKAYVGLVTQDTSGIDFKFGSLVRPGHRGIWRESLRTGKYAINPRCYQAEIVPTAILTLNWALAVSKAHNLDQNLSQIKAKSKEGFEFSIDLQVQIHVPDTQAPRVISMVGTMLNLANEVLQAAVGNHFRDKLQSMPAVQFIQERQQVQEQAFSHIKEQLDKYQVETRGVYIQDVVLPPDLVTILQDREKANQNIQTYQKETEAQVQRIEREKTAGIADAQKDLAISQVKVTIKENEAAARKAEAAGEATYISETGKAQGAQVEAVGMARAKAYEAQVKALGPEATMAVNVVAALADSKVRFTPEILVMGGSGLDGLAGSLMKFLGSAKPVPASSDKPSA